MNESTAGIIADADISEGVVEPSRQITHSDVGNPKVTRFTRTVP
jgi:hypothetical protein